MPQFKQAQIQDLHTALSLLKLYYEYDGHPYDETRAKRGLQQLITTQQLGELWLILLDGNPIGYLALYFGFSLECGGKEAFIDELFILEQHRGRGLGQQVIEHAIQRCSLNEVKALRLETTDENTGALRLYQRLGFQDLGRHLLTRWIETGR